MCLSPDARISSTYKYRGTRCKMGFSPANRHRDVKTSALSKQEGVGSNPARVACQVFFHRHSESTEYTVLYARRCRAKLNQTQTVRYKRATYCQFAITIPVILQDEITYMCSDFTPSKVFKQVFINLISWYLPMLYLPFKVKKLPSPKYQLG